MASVSSSENENKLLADKTLLQRPRSPNSNADIRSSPKSLRGPPSANVIVPDSKTKGEIYTTRLSHYTPNFRLSFSLFLLIRLISAFNNQVADCDETFNYWEPTHFLSYGWGFQTWEYRWAKCCEILYTIINNTKLIFSPEYGIRSYAYILIHAIVGNFAGLFTNEKVRKLINSM